MSETIRAIFKLTAEDYYSYVGTNPSYSTSNRVESALPYQLQTGTVLKYKKLIGRYSLWYRIHVLAEITVDQYQKMIEDNTSNMKQFTNFSYKLVY